MADNLPLLLLCKRRGLMNGLLVRTRFRRVDGSYFSPPHGNSLPEDPLHLDCFLGLQHRSNKKGQKRWLFPTSVSKRKRKPNSEKHNLPTWNPKHSRSLSSKIQLRTAIVRTATHWLGLQQEWRVTNSEKAEEEIHRKIASRNPARGSHNQARYTSPMREWYGKKAPWNPYMKTYPT